MQQITFTVGDVAPVYAELSDSGGQTLTPSAGGAFTLLDNTGTAVTGFNLAPVTGQDPAGNHVRWWYDLNASSLNPGEYLGLFIVGVTGTDGISRTRTLSLQIQVLERTAGASPSQGSAGGYNYLWTAGDTWKASWTEIHSAPEIVSSALLTVTNPSGSPAAPSVTITPGGAAGTHNLSALITPIAAGGYSLAWSISLADGQTIQRKERGFAGWTDLGAFIRRRLRETPQSLLDSDLAAEMDLTTLTLVDRFTSLIQAGGYSAFTGMDQMRFDRAAGLLTAIRLRAMRPKPVPLGEPGSVKLDQNQFVYGPMPPNDATGENGSQTIAAGIGKPIERQWLEEALASLSKITVIAQNYSVRGTALKPFLVSGPTRFQLSRTNITETLLSGVIRLLTDDWNIGVPPEDYYGDYGW